MFPRIFLRKSRLSPFGLSVALVSLLAFSRGAFAAPDAAMGLPPTLSPSAKVEKLAALPTETYTVSGRPFTEGTTCAPNGDVYFVEQNSSKIMRWNVANHSLSTWMHPSGYTNGLSFDGHGDLIACADERNQLWSISLSQREILLPPAPLNPAVGDKAGEAPVSLPVYTVLMDGLFRGGHLNGPNDLWIRPDGGIYFTDPFYGRPWWTPGRRAEQELKTVYFLSPDHRTLTRVLDEFNSSAGVPGTPNGIIGTPDGHSLYIADISGHQTWKYAVQPDGSLSGKTLVCEFGSDGMTLDNAGHLYLSAGGPDNGVTVVDVNSGQQIGFIPVPEQPANMCFGGPAHDTLYIAARTGFYAVPTRVKGASLVK